MAGLHTMCSAIDDEKPISTLEIVWGSDEDIDCRLWGLLHLSATGLACLGAMWSGILISWELGSHCAHGQGCWWMEWRHDLRTTSYQALSKVSVLRAPMMISGVSGEVMEIVAIMHNSGIWVALVGGQHGSRRVEEGRSTGKKMRRN